MRRCARSTAGQIARPLLLLTALTTVLATGCAGNQSDLASSGSALTMNVVWPEDSRVIPTVSNSIRVKVIKDGFTINNQLLAKPTTSVTFNHAPVGAVTVEATSYPNVDGTGNPVAFASVPATVTQGQTATIGLTMASTIDRLHLTTTNTTIILLILATRQITTTCYDVNNNVVLHAPGDLSYQSSNSLIATVDATGLVRGLLPGSATITVTDAISGKSMGIVFTVLFA